MSPTSRPRRWRRALAALSRLSGRRTARPALRRSRVEPFGAIVHLERPRALVLVDRDRARHLGLDGGDRWRDPADDGAVGRSVLSAPLEAHLQLTNRCDAGCTGCYTGASPQGAPAEWGAVEWKRAIDELAAMGVFHLALGGGESAILPWLGEIASHARARGMVPNLTTSGLAGLDRLLPIAHLFGQINVSIDGLGEAYAAVRGFDGFARADAAIAALRAVTPDVGINVVVTRHNYGELDAIFAYARRRRLSEIELLRFKPSGRGARTFAAMTCTDDQHRGFLPTVLAAARRHRVRVRVDCSYTPMLAHHQPDRALLAGLCVYGCTGGDFLIGAKATGAVTACSFAAPAPPGADGERPRADRLAAYWGQDGAFGPFRTWRDAAEPCRSCDYHDLCRGGCKVVSAHIAGEASAPDPECPRVVDHARRAAAAVPARRHLPVV
jgi:radical SAM protein with 4Fe4S-binding SPASM domain